MLADLTSLERIGSGGAGRIYGFHLPAVICVIVITLTAVAVLVVHFIVKEPRAV